MAGEIEKAFRIRIRERITPKVNQFFRLVAPVMTCSFDEIGWLLFAVILLADIDFLAATEYWSVCIYTSSTASLPVESSTVECMFSSARLVANGKRSNLSTDKLHRICLVRDNYRLLLWFNWPFVALGPTWTWNTDTEEVVGLAQTHCTIETMQCVYFARLLYKYVDFAAHNCYGIWELRILAELQPKLILSAVT